MARAAIDDNQRMAMRIRAEDKRFIMRAAALQNMDLSQFVVQHAVTAARAVIEQEEHLHLSARDSVRVMDALENPPAPNAKMLAALGALPPDSSDS